jgi:hypothetical protein
MVTFPRVFIALVSIVLRVVRTLARSQADLVMENLVLRQQVLTLMRDRPRPDLDDVGRGFWAAVRESWPGWVERLVIVRPETVVRWHRERFRRYWTRLSHKNRRRPGRPRMRVGGDPDDPRVALGLSVLDCPLACLEGVL